MDIAWMEWTPLTFRIFLGVVAVLSSMTVWDLISPSQKRKGFLPFGFTRGERLFLSVVTFLATMLLFLAFLPETNLYYALPVAAVLILIVVRWG